VRRWFCRLLSSRRVGHRLGARTRPGRALPREPLPRWKKSARSVCPPRSRRATVDTDGGSCGFWEWKPAPNVFSRPVPGPCCWVTMAATGGGNLPGCGRWRAKRASVEALRPPLFRRSGYAVAPPHSGSRNALFRLLPSVRAPVAQWTERRTSNPRVGGSNPPRRVAPRAAVGRNALNVVCLLAWCGGLRDPSARGRTRCPPCPFRRSRGGPRRSLPRRLALPPLSPAPLLSDHGVAIS
jgi:hypothetical protein